MSKLNKLDTYAATQALSPRHANHQLFEWLSDDEQRLDLYRCLRKQPQVLKIQSRADVKQNHDDHLPNKYVQDIYFLSSREHVEQAFKNSDSDFSNAPFKALGSGNFMLEMDKSAEHTAQRAFAGAYLHFDAATIHALCTVSFLAAAVLPLKRRHFDMAELAEQAALRFVGFLFGFAQADHVMLEGWMRKTARALSYQTFARHFVTDPAAIPDNAVALAALAKRIAELIDLYQGQIGTRQSDEFQTIEDELKELRGFEFKNSNLSLAGFTPILRRMGSNQTTIPNQPPCNYSTNELAVIVSGLIAGTVSNVQSGAALVISELFRGDPALWRRAYDAAIQARLTSGSNAAEDPQFKPFVWEALRLNPPVAFLPRSTTRGLELGNTSIPQGSVVILAVGAATRDVPTTPDQFDETRPSYDPLIFGGTPDMLHQCLGQNLAMPLISHIARQTMLLPGLAESLDPRSGQPFGMQKVWGYHALSYPMEYNRPELLKQSPLYVVMNVKMPLSEHAEALKKVIKYGAPRIEKKLKEARHVHFAFFMFLENDSKLALFTVYDRDFDSYIAHFASEIGPLFDRIFEHIQDAPPLPVNEFQKEFVDTIRRFNQHPAGEYFFSAYPQADVAGILQTFSKGQP